MLHFLLKFNFILLFLGEFIYVELFSKLSARPLKYLSVGQTNCSLSVPLFSPLEISSLDPSAFALIGTGHVGLFPAVLSRLVLTMLRFSLNMVCLCSRDYQWGIIIHSSSVSQ